MSPRQPILPLHARGGHGRGVPQADEWVARDTLPRQRRLQVDQRSNLFLRRPELLPLQRRRYHCKHAKGIVAI